MLWYIYLGAARISEDTPIRYQAQEYSCMNQPCCLHCYSDSHRDLFSGCIFLPFHGLTSRLLRTGNSPSSRFVSSLYPLSYFPSD